MRPSTLGAFVVGVAVGILILGSAIWYRMYELRTVGAVPAADTAKLNLPPPLPSPTPLTVPPVVSPPSNRGDADRTLPESAGPPHLAMPLAGVNTSSLTEQFYDSRDGRKHEALDFPAARGTPVLAVAEGNVVKLFTSKEGGLTVYQFDNSQKYCFYYAHLDHYQPGLKEGTLLRKGEVLGYVGSTGNADSKAPHLHLAVFELGPEKKWWQGKAIDPLPLLK